MENKKDKEPKETAKPKGLGWIFFGAGFLVVVIFRLAIWMCKATIECVYFVLGFLLGKKKAAPMPASEVHEQANFLVAPVAVAATEDVAQTPSILWRQFGVTLETAQFTEFDDLLIADAVMGTFRLGLTEQDGKQVIKRFVDMPRSKHDHEQWRRCTEVMERVHLSDYTDLTAAARSRNFSADDAYALTKQEVKRVWDSFKKRNWVAQEIVATPAPSSPTTAQAAPVAKVITDNSAIQAEEDEGVSGGSSSYTGEVLSAHRVEVRAEGKKPYQIFQVVLQTDKGKEELNGKDLEVAFNEQKFVLGNRVNIVKSKRSYELSQGGSVKQRYKNVFAITVLK